MENVFLILLDKKLSLRSIIHSIKNGFNFIYINFLLKIILNKSYGLNYILLKNTT